MKSIRAAFAIGVFFVTSAFFITDNSAYAEDASQPPQQQELKEQDVARMWQNIDSALASVCVILLPNGTTRGFARVEMDELRSNVVLLSNHMKHQQEIIQTQKTEIDELKKQIPVIPAEAPATE